MFFPNRYILLVRSVRWSRNWNGRLLGIGLVAAGTVVVWLATERMTGAAMPPAPLTYPKRVVSVSLASDEILLELAPEKLVAVSALATVFDRAATVPQRVGVDIERILLLDADVVAIGGHDLAVAQRLEELGVRVVRITGYDSIDWLRSQIRTLGEVVGEAARAEAMIAAMDRRLAAVAERVKERPKPLVAFYSMSGWIPDPRGRGDPLGRRGESWRAAWAGQI